MKVLILGGAGFIGSNIAKCALSSNHQVTVLDGFLDRTGARRANLNPILKEISLIEKCIEKVSLSNLLDENEVVVDCMGWTSHHAALKDPVYDISLNLSTHITFLEALKESSLKKVIYLGSRGLYGNVLKGPITEETPLNPVDVQGINKTAAENYFRLYSKLYNIDVATLRFGNTFGENQPTDGFDIGLIGSFIRDALENKTIKVFGIDRRRDIINVSDLAKIVVSLVDHGFSDFNAFNVSGHDIPISELAYKIVEVARSGKVDFKELTGEVKSIDVGSLPFDGEKLKKFLGRVELSDLDVSLKETIDYFKKEIS